MKYLILVESPAKCNKILSFLDKNYLCEATYGHLREFKSLKSIDNKFNIKFENIPEKKRQITKIENKIKMCDEVILATDDDREGEGIAWHIIDMFQLPINTKRIKFNSITKDSILHALNTPTKININMVESQQTRQILDILVGFKISPILWNEISRNNNLSAGRCQSPALNILYENYIKNKDALPELSYQPYGYFSGKNIKFILNKNFKNENDLINFLNVCNNLTSYNLNHEIKYNTEKLPPNPFITSSLQQSCSNLFNISPKECMSICQTLYESGHITYMRTDSYYISDKFKSECKKFISEKYGSSYFNDKYSYKNKKGSQEAHEAIRPTNLSVYPSLTGKQEKIYKLIYNQTLKSLMISAIIDVHKFIATVDDDYKFIYTCDYIKRYGWMILLDKEKDDFISYLSNLSNITCNKIIGEATFSNTSLHYSEAKLIKELEDKNIGRPSTFASIVEKLKERKYINKCNTKGNKIKYNSYELYDNKIFKKKEDKLIGIEKNKLIIQPLGIMVNELLIKHFNNIFNYSFTEQMENCLDSIANGNNNKVDTCLEYEKNINNYIKLYNNSEKKKIMIDDNHEFIISKNGPIIKCTLNNEVCFKKIKSDFDIEKLKKGEYSINDIIDESNNERKLGYYKDIEIILKIGKFGNYIEYGDKNISIKTINKEFHEITITDVIDILDNKSNILRQISNEISIRNGKFGDYIFYKTDKMKKPKFIPLKKINEDYLNCDANIIKNYVNETIKLI